MPVTISPDWNRLANRPSLAAIATSGSAADLEAGTVPPARLNGSGTAPVYPCRAWVNFNGTGIVAINASGNVSSITDNGVGDYTVNFTTAMPDANYAAIGAAAKQAGNFGGTVFIPFDATAARNSSAYRFLTRNAASAAAEDPLNAEVAVFR